MYERKRVVVLKATEQAQPEENDGIVLYDQDNKNP
jgi:hypothetical protein